MPAVAVCLHLQDVWPLAGEHVLQRPPGGVLHRPHVHAVHLLAGNAEGRTAHEQLLRLRRGAVDFRAHGVAVVLDDVDDGQLPQRGHVEALVHLPLVGRAFAEEGEAGPVLAIVVRGEGQPGADGHLRADNAVPAPEVPGGVEHVHGAALALRHAGQPPRQLRHYRLRLGAGEQLLRVAAIGGDDVILRPARHEDAGGHRLLPDIQVQEAADVPHAVELAGLFLEAADEQHVAQRALLLLLREGGRMVGLRPAAGGLAPAALACGGRFRCHAMLPARPLRANRG